MNTMRHLTLLFALIICGCTTTPTKEYRAGEEDVIRETALLERLALRDTSLMIFVAFLQSDGSYTDPPNAVISNIRKLGIPAQKASASTTDKHTSVIDRTTGKPGIVYYARVIKWHGSSKVEVITGVKRASLAGGSTLSIMQKENGTWIRTKIKSMVTY